MYSIRGYEQGIGYINLNVLDNRIEMYVEKGYIKKNKYLIKVITISEIEKIETYNSELIIKLKNGEIDKIKFEREEYSKRIYDALVNQKSIKIKNKFEKNSELVLLQTIKNSISFIEFLFDLIINLDEKIKWQKIEDNLKNIIDVYNKIKTNYNKFVDLDFSKIEQNIFDRDPEKIPFEVFNILKEMVVFYRGLDKGEDKDVISFKYKFPDFIAILESAFILNDIILGISVGDANIDKEIDFFIEMINSAFKKRNIYLETNYFLEQFQELKFKGKDDQIINKLRGFLYDLVTRYFS